MTPSKEKSEIRARRFPRRGELDQAIRSYLEVLDLDKNDAQVLLRLAALFLKNHERDQAVEHYLQAADLYSGKGYFEKAVAAHRQALSIGQSLKGPHRAIAELYHRINSGHKK